MKATGIVRRIDDLGRVASFAKIHSVIEIHKNIGAYLAPMLRKYTVFLF